MEWDPLISDANDRLQAAKHFLKKKRTVNDEPGGEPEAEDEDATPESDIPEELAVEFKRQGMKQSFWEKRKESILSMGFVIGPWAIYTLTLFLFTFYLFHNAIATVTFFVLGATCFTLGSFLVNTYWLKMATTIGLVSMIVGMVGGVGLYVSFSIYYYSSHEGRIYTNVAASQASAEFEDASMILFSSNSQVDTSRAVGFQAYSDGGKYYCAAPIVDSTMTLDDPIRYWAIGMDCCGGRASFFCDDVGVHGARAGLVRQPTTIFSPPYLSWLMAGEDKERKIFHLATRLTANAFATNLPPENVEPIFVRWVRSPKSTNRRKLISAIQWVAIYSAIAGVAFYFVSGPNFRKPPTDPDAVRNSGYSSMEL